MSWSDDNGLRYTGLGQTKRGRMVLLVLVPNDKRFDRYTMHDPLTYGEYWDDCRYWLLVTAFVIENS